MVAKVNGCVGTISFFVAIKVTTTKKIVINDVFVAVIVTTLNKTELNHFFFVAYFDSHYK